MTFALSRAAMLNEIYAASAMYAMINKAKERPPVLHRDHEAMLSVAIDRAFVNVAMALVPHLLDLDSDDAEILTIDIELPPLISSEHIKPLRRTIEHAIVSEVLAEAYGGYSENISGVNRSAAAEALSRLRRRLGGTGYDAALVPEW